MTTSDPGKTGAVKATPAQLLEERLKTQNATIAVVGMGYVGMPLAHAVLEAGFNVLGFDVPYLVARAEALGVEGAGAAGAAGAASIGGSAGSGGGLGFSTSWGRGCTGRAQRVDAEVQPRLEQRLVERRCSQAGVHARHAQRRSMPITAVRASSVADGGGEDTQKGSCIGRVACPGRPQLRCAGSRRIHNLRSTPDHI